MCTSWTEHKLKTSANAQQKCTVALRVNKKRCFNAVVGPGWFATEDKKSPIKFDFNSPISLAPWVTRFNCAGVSYTVWYHSFRGSLSLEVTLVCPVDAIIFVARTMFYCDDMGQMAQSFAVQNWTVSLLLGDQQNWLFFVHETVVPITVSTQTIIFCVLVRICKTTTDCGPQILTFITRPHLILHFITKKLPSHLLDISSKTLTSIAGAATTFPPVWAQTKQEWKMRCQTTNPSSNKQDSQSKMSWENHKIFILGRKYLPIWFFLMLYNASDIPLKRVGASAWAALL